MGYNWEPNPMKKIFLFLILAAFAIQANAQTHFSIHLGAGFPQGDFGTYKNPERVVIETNGKHGGATIGFNIGMKAKIDIPSIEGLGIIATGDFFLNGITNDIEDDMDKDYAVTLPKYINIPLMVGANYTYPIADNIGLFGEAAIGINFRKITDLTLEGEDDVEEVDEISFDNATSLAFQVGAGFIFNEKFSVGIHYYSLGTSKVKGDVDYSYIDPYYGEEHSGSGSIKGGKLSTSILALRIGFHF